MENRLVDSRGQELGNGGCGLKGNCKGVCGNGRVNYLDCDYGYMRLYMIKLHKDTHTTHTHTTGKI